MFATQQAMNNSRWTVRLDSLLLAVALLLSISAIGCDKKDSEGPGEETPAINSTGKPVDTATAGTVTGIVKFDGAPPRAKTINMASVPSCAKLHSSPAMSEEVVLGENGALQNVVVYLKGDFSQYAFPRSTTPVKVDQSGCVYAPHVVALMTGEPLQVTTSDATTHNVNAMSARGQGWNQTQAPDAPPIERTFSREEVAIAVKCNIHAWMRFYLVVLGNPYFAVTGKDGSFTLNNVPPGTYTLTAWHERYGSKEQTITVKPNLEQNISIPFNDRDRR